MLDLVAEEPEPVGGLEMVARGRLAVAGRAAGEEVVVRALDRGPRREDARGEVQAADGCYEARAAASSKTSMSGTSAAS